MPFIRWNCEPSPVEEGCRLRVKQEGGLVHLMAERRPSTHISLTFTAHQALILSDLLRRASRNEFQNEVGRGSPNDRADRRS